MKLLTPAQVFVLLIFLFVPFTGCSATNEPNNKTQPIILSVSPDKLIRIIPRTIYGTNLEWFNNGNGFWQPNNNRLDPVLTRLLQEQNVSLVRFPGGTFSDFYLWKDGIGPIDKRPERPHYTDPGSSKNYFGSPELLQLCTQTGAKPLITVNASTGSPEMAADWLRYMNTPDDHRRQNDGFTLPQHVQYWEIGNELYLAGSEAEKSITMTPENYATTYLEFAHKMRDIDPAVKLMAIGRAGSYSIPFGPYTTWNETVLRDAGEEMDLLSVHNSYFPILMQTGTLSNKEVYQAMWGAPLAVAEDLQKLSNLIEHYEGKRTINLAVTEWGPFFSMNNPKFIDHIKTLGSAVYVARILQEYIRQPRLEVATYFKFSDQNLMGWVSYQEKPKIPYYAFAMYSNHFGTRLVHSEINSPTFNTRQLGFNKKQNNVPELNVIAATNDDNSILYINIVSCSWDKSYQVQLDFGHFQPETKAKLHLISAPSPLTHNGQDLPDWWPMEYEEPGPTQDPPVTIITTDWQLNTEIEVPPHSIMTIELYIKKS